MQNEKKSYFYFRVRLVTLAIFLASLFLVAGQTMAEQKGPNMQQKEMQQAQKEAQKYSKKLENIQKKVLENNPKLKKQLDDLKKLQKQKLDKMVSENATRKEKMKAYIKLRQDKELQQKKKQYRKDILEAMKKEDPKTEEYIQKLQDARQKLRRQRKNRSGKSQSE